MTTRRRCIIATWLFLFVMRVAGSAHATCTAGIPNTPALPETTPSSAFVDHGDGTITHLLTGLMWQRCLVGTSGSDCSNGSPAELTWSAALTASVSDTTAGYHDWRLPNAQELVSMVEFCGTYPSWNTAVFPPSNAMIIWSSTTDPLVTGSVNPLIIGNAYYFAFQSTVGLGASPKTHPSGRWQARFVRGGRIPDAFDASRPLQAVLDVDASGKADALTDGLLILRYLFGLRGAALTSGAVGPNAVRSTDVDIVNFLQNLTPQ